MSYGVSEVMDQVHSALVDLLVFCEWSCAIFIDGSTIRYVQYSTKVFGSLGAPLSFSCDIS